MATTRAPWWLLLLAAAFLAYFGLLVYCDNVRPVPAGIQLDFSGSRITLTGVSPGSPADRAGLEAGDVVVSRDGLAVDSRLDWTALDANIVFDQPIHLDVDRRGTRLHVVMVMSRAPWWRPTTSGAALTGMRAVQLVTLLLGLFIAFRRPNKDVARMGGWLLATVGVFSVVVPYRFGAAWRALPTPLGLLLWIPFVSAQVVPAQLLTFFEMFPRRRSRRGWVRLLIWMPIVAAILPDLLYYWRMVYQPARVTARDFSKPLWVVIGVSLAYIAATLATLVVNYRRTTDVTDRRRMRVLVVGSTIGCGAAVVLTILYYWSSPYVELLGSPAFILLALLLLAMPLSFAYGILRHRLFDVRVIIRQGVRYAVARGFLLSLVPVLAALFGLDLLLHGDRPIVAVLQARAWIYLVLAGVTLVAYRYRASWLSALDRRFFRERYDANRLLRIVAEDVRRSGDFDQVAERVVRQIEAALHPEYVALLVRRPAEPTYRVVRSAGPREPLAEIPADSKLVDLLRVLGKPFEVPHTENAWLERQLPRRDLVLLRQARIDVLVPIATDPAQQQVLLALGGKRSEEPYSSDDEELLGDIARNLGVLVERPAATQPEEAFEECPKCGTCSSVGTTVCGRDGAALVKVQAPLLIHARYRLERRLGRGGMGTVYVGHDGALDREVAVKLLRDELAGNTEAAERFRQEARAAAAFAHPNVVTVHDFGLTTRGRGYLVMELLHGVTLREELRHREKFAPNETLAILRGVCSAVEAAHERKIVHRDLKPENIVLTNTSTTFHPKILDFGIAKFVGRIEETGVTRTSEGVLPGTLAYMSPERLRGDDPAPVWDIWSLGVIAWEMLTGRHPFITIMSAGGPAVGPFPTSHEASGVPEASRPFFARALAPEPERRPASASAFLAELERALAAE
jgi:tRNA A-37 threonylcarbamoyl transferase component Bud32